MIDGFAHDPGSCGTDPTDHAIECVVCYRDLIVACSIELDDDGIDYIPLGIDDQDFEKVGLLEDPEGFAHIACICGCCQEAPALVGRPQLEGLDPRCASCYAGDAVEEAIDPNEVHGSPAEVISKLREFVVSLQNTIAIVAGESGDFEFSPADREIMLVESKRFENCQLFRNEALQMRALCAATVGGAL